MAAGNLTCTSTGSRSSSDLANFRQGGGDFGHRRHRRLGHPFHRKRRRVGTLSPAVCAGDAATFPWGGSEHGWQRAWCWASLDNEGANDRSVRGDHGAALAPKHTPMIGIPSPLRCGAPECYNRPKPACSDDAMTLWLHGAMLLASSAWVECRTPRPALRLRLATPRCHPTKCSAASRKQSPSSTTWQKRQPLTKSGQNRGRHYKPLLSFLKSSLFSAHRSG